VVWRNSRREEDRLRGLVGEFMFPFLSDRKGKQIFSSVLGGMSFSFQNPIKGFKRISGNGF
ncbi:MAG: hypothetical protein KC964_04450, partial [Candidatus Omnitrophica bacterium]|nr:hypothetical protein [Candidatus Omnitrophota bacterium]